MDLPGSTSDAESGPDCGRCAHYCVSWDRTAPHACRLFEFKSRKKPSRVVFESSGRHCGEFRERRGATAGHRLL